MNMVEIEQEFFLYRLSFQVRIRVVGTPAGRSVRSSDASSGTEAEGGGSHGDGKAWLALIK